MSETNNEATNTAPTEGTGTTPSTSEEGVPLGDGTVWRNAKEVKEAIIGSREMRRELQELRATVSELASMKAPKADKKPESNGTNQHSELAAKMEHLERTMSFKDSLLKHDLDGSQRAIINELFEAQRPDNPSQWLQEKIEQFNFQPKPVAETSDDKLPQTKAPNPGASGRTPGGEMQGDPRIFAKHNPDAWKRMDPAKRAQWRAEWKRQQAPGLGLDQAGWPALRRMRRD